MLGIKELAYYTVRTQGLCPIQDKPANKLRPRAGQETEANDRFIQSGIVRLNIRQQIKLITLKGMEVQLVDKAITAYSLSDLLVWVELTPVK